MKQKQTIIENVYKHTDETIRKAILLSKITELIEQEILSSVRLDAFARLQKK